MGHPLLELGDKTAVVIGGTSGIGLALARGLAQAGANVIPTGRRAAHVQVAAEEVHALGRKTLAMPADVTDKSSLEALLQAAIGRFGSAEILVNCAGRTQRTPTLRTPMDRFGRVEELVGAAVFLSSDAASFVTGHLLVVDGGILASGVNQ
jgi:NAD(P)-dependent dehydrogenase (short-subunit alcohol dehydrogenase family)